MIKVGDKIPSGEFAYVKVSEDEDITVCQRPGKPMSTESWKGKKVVLFGIPGAFTPCQENHLPPFLEKASEIKAKGVDQICCLATNDAFVMASFARVTKAGDKVLMISDGSAKWLEETGLSIDLSSHGMGIRAARFAMIVDDLVVKYIGKEEGPGGVTVSSADAILKEL